MPLKTVVEDINTVPEGQRDLYTEQDGKFLLQVEDIDVHPSVAGLKSAHVKTQAQLKELKDRFKGIDPEVVAQLMADKAAAEEKLLANDPDKLRAKLEADFNKKLEDERKRAEGYRSKFHDVALRDRVKTVALNSGVNTEDLDDVVTLTMPRFDLDEETLKIKVLDEDGTESLDTVEKYFGETFKAKKPKFYKSDRGEGGGAGGSGGTAGRSAGGTITLSKAEAQNVQTYRAARERAAKEGKTLVIGD